MGVSNVQEEYGFDFMLGETRPYDKDAAQAPSTDMPVVMPTMDTSLPHTDVHTLHKDTWVLLSFLSIMVWYGMILRTVLILIRGEDM